jgi:hypothetical protein
MPPDDLPGQAGIAESQQRLPYRPAA